MRHGVLSCLLLMGGLLHLDVVAKSEIILHLKNNSTFIFPLAAIDSITFTKGLLTYYPFNGNTLDQSGNNNAGLSYSGGFTSDRFGKERSAYQFDGTTNNFFVPRTNATKDFTLAAWIFSQTSSKEIQIILGDMDTVNNAGYVFYMTKQNNLIVAFGDGSTQGWPYASLKSISAVPGDEWHFVVAVRDGETLKIYVDGKLDATGPCGPNDIAQLTFYSVGGRILNGFHGKIDDARFYDVVLSEDKIRALMNDGGAIK